MKNTMPTDEKEWLSLKQAAILLGVHPSTVRLWSDKGRIPVYRTQGNHRRYLRSEVELWVQTTRHAGAVEPENIIQFALRRIRFKINKGQLEAEAWYQQLSEDAREQYRQSGRSLVQGLASYLSSKGPAEMDEALSLGYEYASRGRRCDLDNVDAARAFLFFRNALLESMITVYQEAWVPSGAEWGEMLTRTFAFTDRILLALLETYQALERNNP
jgi:excisionase family DNA binding protein